MMKIEQVRKLKEGDRIYRYHDTGAMGVSLIPMTVLHVNKATVTVIDDLGNVERCPFNVIEGRYNYAKGE